MSRKNGKQCFYKVLFFSKGSADLGWKIAIFGIHEVFYRRQREDLRGECAERDVFDNRQKLFG